MRICQWCGKEITRTDKFKYCSTTCYQKATRHNQNERRKLMPKKEPLKLTTKKCKNCGKEFMQKATQQEHCCYNCSLEYNSKKMKMRNKITRIANKYNFELKNMEKIINAKMRFFDEGERHRCPCDSQNPNRFCGSPLCIADTVYKGHCCCQLFWSKQEPELTKYLEKKEN